MAGAASASPPTICGIVDHPAHDGGETGETTRADLYADGVAHDVFELVRLVDHHHFVLRQQHVSTGHVEAVEVQVDHDHVGHRGPRAGQLGEAHRTHRALRAAGALVAADTDGLPRTIVGRPVEVGLITGLGGARPLAEPLDLDLGRRGEVLDLELALTGGRLQLARRAACRCSCSGPSAPPTRTAGRDAPRGTAGPWRPTGPATPSWRWRRRSACP